MPKSNFLLVSLEDLQAKQLAEVLSNDTCRKIMDFLAQKEDATETDISSALSIPLPTVHYNLQNLKKAQLVTAEEFHYSKKGREVDHYKLENKYVIITPKPVKGIKNALRSILPVSLVFAGITALLAINNSYSAQKLFTRTADFAAESASLAMNVAEDSVLSSSSAPWPFWLWFLIGGIVTIILFIIIQIIRARRST